MPRFIETKTRTLVKALLLRVIVFIIITLTTVFIFRQSFLEGIEFAIMDIIIELLVHYVYDRIWGQIKWGTSIEEEDNDIEQN